MESFSTQHPMFAWWVITTLVTIVGMPVSFSVFRWFHTRGLVISRIFSWLLWSYLAWILVSLGIFEYSAETLVITLVLLMVLSVTALMMEGKEFFKTFKSNYKVLLICEMLFLTLFLIFCLIRAYNPDIAQQEKEADFAFLNGILRSSTFPPLDPWMSGETLNYFYFGFYCVANIIKISGIPSPVGFNLAVSMLLALATTGVFIIIYNRMKNYKWAAMGAAIFGLMGNLQGFVAVTSSKKLYPFDWWSSGHDTIPRTVHEFPYWSFILGDLHAHYISLPFSILFFAMMANLFWSKGNLGILGNGKLYKNFHVVLTIALSFGASVWVINKWDLPTYTIVLVLTIFLTSWNLPDRLKIAWWGKIGLLAGFILLMSKLYFITFTIVSPLSLKDGGVVPDRLRSHIGPFLTLHGFFLFVIGSYFIMLISKFFPKDKEKSWALSLSFLLMGFLSIIVLKFTALVLLIYMIAAGLLIWWKYSLQELEQVEFFYVMLGLCILLGCELVYLDPTYGENSLRYNTVFKFYYQLWIILSLAIPPMIQKIWKERTIAGEKLMYSPWKTTFFFLFTISFTFTVFATYTKCNRFKNSKNGGVAWVPTLNGNAYINHLYPGEGDALEWIRKNIKNAPVILEATGNAYSFMGRVAANTGVPTVLGWANHEGIWRKGFKDENNNSIVAKINAERTNDIKKIYTALTVREITPLLKKYNVEYICLGVNEKKLYQGPGLDKFKNIFQTIYKNTNVTIYKVNPS